MYGYVEAVQDGDVGCLYNCEPGYQLAILLAMYTAP